MGFATLPSTGVSVMPIAVIVRHADGTLAYTVDVYPTGKGTSQTNAVKAALALATTPGCVVSSAQG